MGLVAAEGGRVRLAGTELGPLPAHRRARLGLGYMPEDRRLIGGLSVADNLRLLGWAQNIPDFEARLRAVYELIPELKELGPRPAAALSGGQQKLVALGRSFLGAKRLLLLDEPFEGLAPALAERLLAGIRAFKDREAGLAVLVCESAFDWVRRLADQIYTIERGEISAA